MPETEDPLIDAGSLSALVIDDDPGDLLLTRHVLELSGRFGEIITVDSAEEGLSFFEQEPGSPTILSDSPAPTVIFLDLWMPRVTGIDFLCRFDKIRQSQDLSSVVIAMLTSSADEKDRTRATAFDFVIDYLVKPLQLQEIGNIRRAVHDLWEKREP